MYKLANGWTKAKVMEQVKKYNNGFKASETFVDNDGRTKKKCVYQTKNGNRCAIGCFIPDGHEGLQHVGPAGSLVVKFPKLSELMPFNNIPVLIKFQGIHDGSIDGYVYGEIENFLTNECEE